MPGEISKITYGNGLMQSYVYEPRLQLCRMTLYSSGTPTSACSTSLPSGNIQDFGLAYANYGSTNSGIVTYWAAYGVLGFGRAYTYDSLNRLSSLSDGTTTNPCPGLSWSYDPWANLTAKTVTLGSCGSLSLNFNTSNHITNTGVLYDAAGNMTNDGTHSYTYDAKNRITAVGGASTASYVYNAHGQRVLKTTGGVTTEYYHDLSGNVLGEANGMTVTTGYLYLNNKLLAEYTGGTTYFIHQDHLGSTRFMTTVSGSVCEWFDYLPFGELNGSSGTCTTTHKFTGYERDPETGDDYARARHYTPQFGRFLQPDPAGTSATCLFNPQTQNRYVYVTDNPVTRTDPTGLCGDGDNSDCGGIGISLPIFPGGGGEQPKPPTPHPVFDSLSLFSLAITNSRILSCAQAAVEKRDRCLNTSADMRNQTFAVCTIVCAAGGAAGLECITNCYAAAGITYGLDVSACEIEYGLDLAKCKLH